MHNLKEIFIVIFLLTSLKSFAGPTPPKVPDPFCSPTDFFTYLNNGNHDRVLYIVQKCSNIDLNELGPKGETFVQSLALAGWEDIFTIVKDNKEINFQPALLSLLMFKRFVWVDKLLERESLKFGAKELAVFGTTFPDSKNLLAKLVELGRVDLNIVTEEKLSFLLASVKWQRYDLVEFLRSIPSVDQGQLFSYTCSLIYNADPKNTHRQYFYLLMKEGKYDVNTTCANGSSLAANVLQSGIDSAVRDEVFFNPNLDYSKPSASYKIVEALARNAKVAEKYFDVVFKNPTFNFKDITPELRNMWHLVATYITTHESTKFITYFANASRDSINDVDKNGSTPLTLLIAASGDRKFDASNPTMKELFKNNDIDINKSLSNRTPLTLAFYYNAYDFAEFLISKGASVTNLGSIKLVEADILKAMFAREKFWDLFFKLPDLDINKSFKADARSDSGTLFSYTMRSEDPARMSKNISQLIKDARFKKDDLDAFYDRYYCSTITSWLRSNSSDRKTLFELAALSSDAGLNKVCFSSANYHTAMSYAALKGDLELVTYLFGTRKLPESVSDGKSAFFISYSNKQWPIVEYFISKGFKVSPNEKPYIEALLRDEKYDLFKKLLSDPEFNPNIGLGYYDSDNLLKLLANEKGKDAFMLLLNNPKLTLGDKLPSLINTYEAGKPAPFLDAALDKFTIKTAEDKLSAVLIAEKFLANSLPVSYFEKISKYKNFDVNLVIPKENSYGDRSHTLLASFMSNLKVPAYTDSILKNKALNPNTVADLHPAQALLEYNSSRDYGAPDRQTLQKYFDLFFAQPTVKLDLPKIAGGSFMAFIDTLYVGAYNEENKRLRAVNIVLSNPKLRLTKEEVTKLASLETFTSSISYDSALREWYYDAFFSNPNMKPLSQWSKIVGDIAHRCSSDCKGDIAFLKKFGSELDLNYRETPQSMSLLQTAIYNDVKELFDYLIVNPKVNLKDVLKEALTSWRTNGEYYRKTLLEKRSKDIANEDFLNVISNIDDINNKPSVETINTFKLILPYIKSFDKLTLLAKDRYVAPLAYYLTWYDLDPVFATIYNRIYKEDKTLLANSNEIIIQALKRSRFDIVDGYIKLGYDINQQIKGETILLETTKLKSLAALKYLASKGIDINSKCSGNYSCSNYNFNAFGVAMNMNWFEGAEYLISLKADPKYENFNYSSSILAAVRRKSLEGVKFLMSKGVSINETGSLVQAIIDQNDDMLTIFLNDNTTKPNDRGYDFASKRTTYPVIEAARFGRIDYVKALLAFPGIDKNIKDSLGYRAIDWAATNNYQDIVVLLKK